jgi:hypothetical protein
MFIDSNTHSRIYLSCTNRCKETNDDIDEQSDIDIKKEIEFFFSKRRTIYTAADAKSENSGSN